MKQLAVISTLILAAVINANARTKTKKVKSVVEYKCAVETLENDNFFDTGLEQYGVGDEDYAFVSLVRTGTNYAFYVGGFGFPARKSSDKITVTQKPARIDVQVDSKTFGKFSWSHEATSNCSYLKDSDGKVIAKTNCLYDRFDFNPCQPEPIQLGN